MTKYVYICSSGYSGSTLLDLILGSHSLIESLGEISHLPKNISLNSNCSCGEPILECYYWKKILSNLNKKISKNIISDPYSFNLGYHQASKLIDHNHQNSYYLLKRKLIMGLVYLRYLLGSNFFNFLAYTFNKTVDNNITLYDTILLKV